MQEKIFRRTEGSKESEQVHPMLCYSLSNPRGWPAGGMTSFFTGDKSFNRVVVTLHLVETRVFSSNNSIKLAVTQCSGSHHWQQLRAIRPLFHLACIKICPFLPTSPRINLPLLPLQVCSHSRPHSRCFEEKPALKQCH